MAHANQKHSTQSPSNAQLKPALSLIAAELARGPLRSSSLSKIMRDTFSGSDASGAWNWRMRDEAMMDMMALAPIPAALAQIQRRRALHRKARR